MDYLNRFQETLEPIRMEGNSIRSARNLEFNKRRVRRGIKTLDIRQPSPDRVDDPWAWEIIITWMAGNIDMMPLILARGIDDVRLAWLANYSGYSRRYQVWYWAASEDILPLPDSTSRRILNGRAVI